MHDPPLTLELLDGRTAYYPGEPMDGIAAWRNLPHRVRRVEVHLCWHTEGRGTEDVAIVETVGFDNPSPVDAKPFRLTAPAGPYSYDGRLIAIRWTIELVAEGVRDLAQIAVIISPNREPFS